MSVALDALNHYRFLSPHSHISMDSLFDEKRGELYYKERVKLFPQDRKGSSLFWNRAGDKLLEVRKSKLARSSL